MDINDAIERIEEIHSHMARTEVFRGYKTTPVFMAGITAYVAAAIQTSSAVSATNTVFVIQWMAIAAVLILIFGISMSIENIVRGSAFERRQVLKVFAQFAPSLIIGFIVTMMFIHFRMPYLKLLPGIWAILFSMGIFAMRPFLPRFIGYAGLFYLAAGCFLLRLASFDLSLTPWAMGLTFGTGNIISAGILYLDKKREFK